MDQAPYLCHKKAVEANAGVSIIPSNTANEEVYQDTLVRIKIRNANLSPPLALLNAKEN